MDKLDQWLDMQLGVSLNKINLNLDNIKSVVHLLNLDKQLPKIIVVGGTNGKGSTVAMLDAILTTLGLTTGTYTSPHFINYTERIKIKNEFINPDKLCSYFSRIKNHTKIPLTYFEYGTIAAMLAFVEYQVDVIILEVGLGGRLDATNVWDADIAILTNIALDHQDWLGDTVEKIGFEKAGIFRSNKPAIIGTTKPPQSVLNHIKNINADLQIIHFSQNENTWNLQNTNKQFSNLQNPPIPGEFQWNNMSCAILAAFNLAGNKLNSSIINQAMKTVSIIGRLQTIFYQKIPIVLDVAHNPAAVRSLKTYIDKQFKFQKITAIFGIMNDKDIEQIIHIIYPCIHRWILFKLPNNRAKSPEKLATIIKNYTDSITITHNCKAALNLAIQFNDPISVFGSFVTVSEILNTLNINFKNKINI